MTPLRSFGTSGTGERRQIRRKAAATVGPVKDGTVAAAHKWRAAWTSALRSDLLRLRLVFGRPKRGNQAPPLLNYKGGQYGF
jgi:hypothetical protein